RVELRAAVLFLRERRAEPTAAHRLKGRGSQALHFVRLRRGKSHVSSKARAATQPGRRTRLNVSAKVISRSPPPIPCISASPTAIARRAGNAFSLVSSNGWLTITSG